MKKIKSWVTSIITESKSLEIIKGNIISLSEIITPSYHAIGLGSLIKIEAPKSISINSFLGRDWMSSFFFFEKKIALRNSYALHTYKFSLWMSNMLA